MELVACLAIICMLVGLLLPVFARSREAARRTSCQSNLTQMGQALHLYAQDYNGRFPPADHAWLPLMPNVKNTGIFRCPNEPPDSQRRHGVTGLTASTPLSLLYSSYQYRSGLASDDAAGEPIGADWEPWHEGTSILYLSGHVRWKPDRTPVRLTAIPRPRP